MLRSGAQEFSLRHDLVGPLLSESACDGVHKLDSTCHSLLYPPSCPWRRPQVRAHEACREATRPDRWQSHRSGRSVSRKTGSRLGPPTPRPCAGCPAGETAGGQKAVTHQLGHARAGRSPAEERRSLKAATTGVGRPRRTIKPAASLGMKHPTSKHRPYRDACAFSGATAAGGGTVFRACGHARAGRAPPSCAPRHFGPGMFDHPMGLG